MCVGSSMVYEIISRRNAVRPAKQASGGAPRHEHATCANKLCPFTHTPSLLRRRRGGASNVCLPLCPGAGSTDEGSQGCVAASTRSGTRRTPMRAQQQNAATEWLRRSTTSATRQCGGCPQGFGVLGPHLLGLALQPLGGRETIAWPRVCRTPSPRLIPRMLRIGATPKFVGVSLPSANVLPLNPRRNRVIAPLRCTMYIGMCVCASSQPNNQPTRHSHRNTHTHTHASIWSCGVVRSSIGFPVENELCRVTHV